MPCRSVVRFNQDALVERRPARCRCLRTVHRNRCTRLTAGAEEALVGELLALLGATRGRRTARYRPGSPAGRAPGFVDGSEAWLVRRLFGTLHLEEDGPFTSVAACGGCRRTAAVAGGALLPTADGPREALPEVQVASHEDDSARSRFFVLPGQDDADEPEGCSSGRRP